MALTNNDTLRSRAWYSVGANAAFVVVVNVGGHNVSFTGAVMQVFNHRMVFASFNGTVGASSTIVRWVPGTHHANGPVLGATFPTQADHRDAKRFTKLKVDDDGIHLSTTWHGPAVRVDSVKGRPVLSIGNRSISPMWFAGHGEAANTSNFVAQWNASHSAGFVLVETLLTQWQLDDTTASGLNNDTIRAMDNILALNPVALVILRPEILPDVDKTVIMCKTNASSTTVSGLATPASDQWLPKAKAGLLPFLRAVDARWPGRIAGVHLTGMSTGEWGWPGAASTGEPGNASATCNGDGPSRVNSYADYSRSMHVSFCSKRLPSGPINSQFDRTVATCSVPTPGERDEPRTGNSFVCGGVLESAAAAEVVRFNLHISKIIANAIGELAKAVKAVTANKALVLAFYGYSLHCTTDRVGSNSRNLVNFGHMAGANLLSNPAIDGFVATYSYSPNTRRTDMPLLPAGEFSSLWAHKKLWVVEDDTRTHLCAGEQKYGGHPLKWCHTLADTLNILRRNFLSASMMNHGSYLFDLANAGWFGQGQPNGDPATATAIWQTMANATAAVSKLDLSEGGPLPQPQIAVFFDEQSAATQPLDNRRRHPLDASSQTLAGDHTLHNSSLELLGIGASFRHYYLSSLRTHTLNVSHIRLAIFLNAFAPTQSMRATILQTFSNATLLFIGPAGLVDVTSDSCTADIARVSTFTGIPGITNEVQSRPTPAYTKLSAASAEVARVFPGLAQLDGLRFGQPEPSSPRLGC